VCVAQVPEPDASTDFIAAYAPGDADLHATAPVKVSREGGMERGGRKQNFLQVLSCLLASFHPPLFFLHHPTAQVPLRRDLVLPPFLPLLLHRPGLRLLPPAQP
jgi:hypothetical protein